MSYIRDFTVSLVKLPSDGCHWTLLMINQYWFRYAIRRQAITWASIEPCIYHHMVSLGPNEFARFFSGYQNYSKSLFLWSVLTFLVTFKTLINICLLYCFFVISSLMLFPPDPCPPPFWPWHVSPVFLSGMWIPCHWPPGTCPSTLCVLNFSEGT